MTQEIANKIVIDRVNEMLQNPIINKKYQAFPTKDDAETWIIKQALWTLLTPINKRKQ